MREIKFRAWDLRNDRMVQDPYVFNEITAGNYVKEYGATYVFYETWQDIDDGIDLPCHIMQYTGLKDKNGKDIYEGDIVVPENINDDTPYVIQWREDLYSIVGVGPDWLSIEEFKGCEVIGNIYQNPELL